MRCPPLNTLSGATLVFSGAVVLLGWLAHQPGLVRLFSSFESIPSPTALGFVLAGLALIATRRGQAASGRHWALAPAGALVMLGIAALLLWHGDKSFGLYQNGGGAWLADGNPYPDRMRPSAAIGFIAVGTAIVLLHMARTAFGVGMAQLLALTTVLVGLMGMMGALFGIKDIFDWYVGTVFHAGVGFILCGSGLLFLGFCDPRFQQYWNSSDSRKISLVGTTIIVVTGAIGVFGSFAVFYPQVAAELQDKLRISLKSRGDTLRTALERGRVASGEFAGQTLVLDAMKRLDRDPEDRLPRSRLDELARRSAAVGLSAVLFRDSAGRIAAASGAFLQDAELAVPIRMAFPATLMWKRGFVLHTRVQMLDRGVAVGTMEAEYPLPGLEKELHGTAYLGDTADFAVCALDGGNMQCFPFRSTGGKVLRNLAPTIDGMPIPASYAVAGASGVVRTKDYRGREVIAAYAPLGSLGLGTVLKIDAAELYRPIARRVEDLLALLLVLGALGVALLRLQVTPLARKMAREIEERKLAEAKLGDSEERFRLISTTANVGIVIIDADEAIRYWNPAAERIFGYREDEAVGRKLHALLSPSRFYGDFQRGFERFRRSGSGPTIGRLIELEALRKDGSEFPIELSISAFRIKGQWHAMGIIQDIAQRKRMERELQQLNQTLEQQVRDEVAKNMEQERLLVQQSRLAAMGEMIGNIAHQWRQPINALALILANVKDDYEFGELSQARLDASVESGNRLIQTMSDTIDDFRNFFRPSTEKKSFRMCEGVAEAVRLVKDSFKSADIEVDVEDCGLPCFALGYPGDYSQVVLNALSNAKDAIVARNVRGKIRIRTELRGSQAVVSIRDNGGGVPEDILGKVFDPYFTTKDKGTGIGLYMSKTIMHKMGGDITIGNVEGGAEVLISLPVAG